MKTPTDLIIEGVMEHIRDLVECSIHDRTKDLGSPIEAILATAITVQSAIVYTVPVDIGPVTDKMRMGLHPQAQVEHFRVDFVVTVIGHGSGKEHKLAIECDGHKFHERTKEQARRDRFRDRRLQQLGYTIFRFTGSEIYRDPTKCAGEVMDWVLENSWGEP